jgi:hypothetical protein
VSGRSADDLANAAQRAAPAQPHFLQDCAYRRSRFEPMGADWAFVEHGVSSIPDAQRSDMARRSIHGVALVPVRSSRNWSADGAHVP